MSKKHKYLTLIFIALIMDLTVLGGCAKDKAQQQEMVQAIEDLKKQIKNLQDVEAIKQLHIRYVNDLTYGKWEDILDCFSEDAVLAVFMDREPIKGKAAIRDAFMNEIAKSDKHVGREANLTLHPLVTVDGDKAKGNWVIYFITQPDRKSQALQLIQGIYDLEYKRVNGQWKMSYIKWTARFALGTVGGEGSGSSPGQAGVTSGGTSGSPSATSGQATSK
jgi:ketosteroid isomerase-like protein